LLAGADGGIGSTYNIMGWRYQGIVKALRAGDIAEAQRLQCECNKVIDLLIKTGVFRGLKTVLHYMDVVAVPLCRKPFAPVAEQFLPELKALAQQLQQRKRGWVEVNGFPPHCASGAFPDGGAMRPVRVNTAISGAVIATSGMANQAWV
jgi:hypothetical protein